MIALPNATGSSVITCAEIVRVIDIDSRASGFPLAAGGS